MKGFEKSGRGNHVGDVRLRQLRVDTTERGRRWTCVECQRYFVSDDSLQKHLQEDHKFPGQTNDKIFYLHSYFFSTESTFAFYVTGEAEPDNLAKITLKNSNDERRFLTSVQGVVSMDSALKDKNEVLASRNVMFVSWRQMSGFLQWSEKDGIQYSKIQATVEIITE